MMWGLTYMTVLIPDSCWNIWRPQPTIRALRVGPWRRIRKITIPPEEQAAKIYSFNGRIINITTVVFCLFVVVLLFIYLKSFTSTSLFLLFFNAGSDGFILHVNILASSDPAENLTGLLAPPLLEEPAGALWQEAEADKLHHCRDNGETQHVPTVRRDGAGVHQKSSKTGAKHLIPDEFVQARLHRC